MGSTRDKDFWYGAAFWTLLALFGMNLLNYIDRYILNAVLAQVQDSFTQGDRQEPQGAPVEARTTEEKEVKKREAADALGGLLTTVFFSSYAVFSPLVAWLEKRTKRTYLLAAGVGIWSVATFASGLARNFSEMALARSVLGVGEAAYATLAPTLIADLYRREDRNRALAFFYVAVPVGSALGFILGTVVEVVTKDWRWCFYLVGVPGLAVALAALLLPEPRRGAHDVEDPDAVNPHALPFSWSAYARLARNRSFVYNTLAMAMLTFALGGLVVFAVKFLNRDRGIPYAFTGTVMGAVAALSGVIGTVLGGRLGDWAARRWRGGYFWMCGVSLLASVPFTALTLVPFPKMLGLGGGVDLSHVLIFVFMFVGLTLVFLNYGPSNAILVNVVTPRLRAGACAVNLFLIHLLGDIPSPYVMGLVSDWAGLFWGMAVTIPALVVGGIFFCMGSPYLEQDQQAVLDQLRSGAKT
jgi:MFS family permease